MGIDGYALIADYGIKALPDHDAFLGPCCVLAPKGGHPPGTDEIQLFHPREDQETEIHMAGTEINL